MPLEVGGRRQRSEVRSQPPSPDGFGAPRRSEGSIKTEVGGQKSEIRGQHKDRGRRSEVRDYPVGAVFPPASPERERWRAGSRDLDCDFYAFYDFYGFYDLPFTAHRFQLPPRFLFNMSPRSNIIAPKEWSATSCHFGGKSWEFHGTIHTAVPLARCSTFVAT